MNEREQIREWIVRYNEGTLQGDELAEFLGLMEQDPELRREVRIDRMVDESLQDTDLLEFRRAMKRSLERGSSARKLPGWLLLAASVLLVIGTGSLVGLLRHARSRADLAGPAHIARESPAARMKGNEEETFTKPGDEAGPGKQVRTNDVLAGNFRPLPSLEALVGEATRTGNFRLKQPGFDIVLTRGDTLDFEWEGGSSAQITLLLVNNKGDRIFSAEPGEQPGFDLHTGAFFPGLYYWKILSGRRLICVGKIRIH